MRIAFEVSYIGTDFCGSQQQPGKRTVLGEIIRCLSELNLFSSEKKDAHIVFSGRTDRGVHARRQILAFNTDFPERAVAAANKKLPPDIRFKGYCMVSESFSPRFDARSRTYRYYFPTDVPGISYDVSLMKDVAVLFKGEHNFMSFSKSFGKDPKRVILSSKVSVDDDFLVYEICGYSFLWNMVRCISYCLDSAGKKEMTLDTVKNALDNPSGNRFPAAPPEGLILWDVDCGIEFTPVNLHEKSILFSKELARSSSQLKKMSFVW
ncbi:tRNA pseudouridine38-40 synthase [Methanomicrobium sp. W14]|uniref:tRNA pseudouridine(38-40) synthase TruA n=1 Tax=Methanomicrobium sp. W14 TaxID=2817839 RepID=UPI001AE40C79|nr:tRNA pseudouridine(38-40) synthase TruA [Methanomicrobium sp. W14]MBP2133785.1 tRNA pseudouridine38-40 synthase [Methanomicrobium sp. W14]